MGDCISSAPKASGVYVLIFKLEAPLEIQVGRLGRQTLPAGHVLYVGSAFGPGGLRARLARHLKSQKRKHWHIDALTSTISPAAYLCDASGSRLECQWAQHLANLPGAVIPVPGFGSSDCRSGCAAHLIAFPVETFGDDLHRVVCDYLAGMTDRYAIQEYKRLFDPEERV